MVVSLRINSTAPNFTAESTDGTLDFYEWIGTSWAILFCHPADFTPVCTTELGSVARLKAKFDQRNCRIIGLSSDELGSHHEWKRDIEETQACTMDFPIIADPDFRIAQLYEMIDSHGVPERGMPMTVRSVFIIDPKKTIRLIMTYPASCGRNFNEIIRCLDSLQLYDKETLLTPASWYPGDPVIVPPSISTEKAKQLYGEDKVDEKKSYLRYVPNP